MNPANSVEVVITGIGIVSPIGIGRDAFWQSLRDGRSGVRQFTTHDLGKLAITFGGELEEFDPKQYVRPRKAIKLMCREIQTGYAAASLAVEDAALDTEAIDSERLGVVFGSEMLYGHPSELAHVQANSAVGDTCDIRLYGKRFPQDMFPLWMLSYLPNMPACHIGICHQAFGANNTIVQGDASSLLSIAEATSIIQRGWTDVMISGGCGTRMGITRLSHISNKLFAIDTPSPSEACRPFDANHHGEVIGEGAGALVLESRAHAEARGVKPLATIRGFGMTFGAMREDYTGPTPDAIERAIQLAMQDANCTAEDLDHVNAHGVSRPDWDAREALAIRHQLNEVPVMAMKSYFGNLGAGSGTVEAAASILGMHEQFVPGTLNHDQTSSECPIHVIGPGGKPKQHNLTLLLSSSTTGQAVAMVLEST